MLFIWFHDDDESFDVRNIGNLFEYFAVIEGNVPFTSTTADVFFFALAKNMDFYLPQDSAVSCNLFMIQKGDIHVIFAGDCPTVRKLRNF